MGVGQKGKLHRAGVQSQMNYGSISEREPLLAEEGETRGGRFKEAETGLLQQETHVFKRRWYILLLFSLVALLQDTVWNTWGPIDHTAIFLYGWSHDLVALLANYGSILYIVAFFPVIYVLNRSLRGAMLMCIGFMALGTVMRAIVLQSPGASIPFFTLSCHICSILNGISNIVIGSGPLVISAVWFPPSERVTATSVAQVLNGLGTGMSFLLASQIVRPIDDLLSNQTFPNGSYPDPSRILQPTELQNIEADIQWYMYSNAVPAGLLFLAILVYFPSAPPLPPSLSSTVERLDILAGFKEVVRTKESWLIAIGCSVPQGVVIAWTAMMVVNLTEICVDSECLTQNWVNNLGIWATLVSSERPCGQPASKRTLPPDGLVLQGGEAASRCGDHCQPATGASCPSPHTSFHRHRRQQVPQPHLSPWNGTLGCVTSSRSCYAIVSARMGGGGAS